MPKLKSGESAVAALDADALLDHAKERLRAQVERSAPVVSKPIVSKSVASKKPDGQSGGSTAPRRSTDRMSISLLGEERLALEERSARLRLQGHRGIKPSRLARIAFHMLLEASDEEILRWAANVENLEVRRVKRG